MTEPASFDPSRRQLFVVGNEAADVDSLVSAYAMATLLDGAADQAFAVAQISREEFRLRGDALALFGRAGCEVTADGSPAKIRFWDEVDWEAVKALGSRVVVLTDHNRMTPKVADIFTGRVEMVLDHHSDTQTHKEAKLVELDEGLGSACTLVAEQFLKKSDPPPQEIGTLLAGVILLDTRNFDPKENKGTPRDRAAMDCLSAFVPAAGADVWYQELSDARKDVSHLSVKELLMLDMKVAAVAGFSGQVAFCAMMAPLDEVLAKADGGSPSALVAVLQAYAAERGYEAVVCNFAKDEQGLKALVLAPATPAQQALCDAVEQRVAGAPGNLPEELRANALYEAQGILEHGFGLAPREDLAPLRALAMRAEISRKTLLPRAAAL